MTLLPVLLGLLIPVAHAVTLNQVGFADGPGVASMWISICQTLPFCDIGAGAAQLLVTKISTAIFMMISVVAVIMIIYSGIQLTMSQGSADSLSDAKKIIMYALVGIALALLAHAIVLYVATWVIPVLLGGPGA